MHNLVARNVSLDRVDLPVHLYQTNGGHSGDAPSRLSFSSLRFEDWTGTVGTSNKRALNGPCTPLNEADSDRVGSGRYRVQPRGTVS